MLNKKIKQRYSIPFRIIDLLYTDDSFFNDVLKIKKVSSSNKFPKSDEWRDEHGFNLSFALAGYAPENISIEADDQVLTIRGDGIDSIDINNFAPKPPDSETEFNLEENNYENSQKEIRPRIHVGSITRGIARRKFCVQYLISEEFDLSKTEATMEYGLLNVLIPNKEIINSYVIKIKNGR